MDIKYGEVLSPLESADNVGCKRERVSIFDYYFVKLLMILHKAKVAILRLDKENRGRERGFGGADILVPIKSDVAPSFFPQPISTSLSFVNSYLEIVHTFQHKTL
jgi:hypothetical protein